MSEDGAVLNPVISLSWGESMRLHIFIKEVLAVCRYVQKLLTDGHHGHFVVAEDNTAAKHALNRLYSTNSCANSEITALADSLKATPLIPARVTLG